MLQGAGADVLKAHLAGTAVPCKETRKLETHLKLGRAPLQVTRSSQIETMASAKKALKGGTL
jgi:hypothetical protein